MEFYSLFKKYGTSWLLLDTYLERNFLLIILDLVIWQKLNFRGYFINYIGINSKIKLFILLFFCYKLKIGKNTASVGKN